VPRAMFQILVLPFRRCGDEFEFGCVRRSDDQSWQGLAGGGEEGETPAEAAIRESIEEAGIPAHAPFYRLGDSLVIPEYAFAVDCTDGSLRLSHEHTEQCWGTYESTWSRLRWDSNRTALWKLHERLQTGRLGNRIDPP
jgi:dATP pyrophosphohydrolase